MSLDGTLEADTIQNVASSQAGLAIQAIAQDLAIDSTKDVTLTTSKGSVSVSALRDILLKTTSSTSDSSITLDGDQIRLANLAVGGTDGFTLCACGSNGKVYTVASATTCAAEAGTQC
jgi:DNA gyrase/topoisomerase IV subunit A